VCQFVAVNDIFREQRAKESRTGAEFVALAQTEAHAEWPATPRRLGLRGIEKANREGLALNRWWPGAESNHRHADFQSAALPTELPGQASVIVASHFSLSFVGVRFVGVRFV
jgi:hypothetical protein